ncbi:MAG: hypothetical protein GEU73_15295 [Chloroflexi bacterium]|nr:hypothetical protein [Chloroflexota bacterium]
MEKRPHSATRLRLRYTGRPEEGTLADRIPEAGVVALSAVAWTAVAYVVLALTVSPAAQAVFYAAGFVALTGTAAILLELYHARAATSVPRPRAASLLGTGMRFAVTVEFALWLQSLRILTAAYLVLLIAGFLALEYVIQQVRDQGNRHDV